MPWGMYNAVTYVKEHYANPIIIISENGIIYNSLYQALPCFSKGSIDGALNVMNDNRYG